jgi:hypothetical protein
MNAPSAPSLPVDCRLPLSRFSSVAAAGFLLLAAMLVYSPEPVAAAEPIVTEIPIPSPLNIEGYGGPVPDQKPRDAAEIKVILRLRDDIILQEGRALLVRPNQVLRLALETEARQSKRLPPPIANAPDGAGPGGIQLSTQRQVAWNWSAGKALDADSDALLWRGPDYGGTFEISCRLLDVKTMLRDNGTPKAMGREWGKAAFSVLVGETFQPGDLMLNGVAIGVYPDQMAEDAPQMVLENSQSYAPPTYMFKVTPEVRSLKVSDNFTLGDFAMDPRKFGDRQYIALSPALIERLELLTRALQRHRRGSKVRLLRGYISPIAADVLRKEGANISKYSRFLYGDAAAIIVDDDGDMRMDDVNQDGVVNGEDAIFLAALCEEAGRGGKAGGLGIYGYSPDPTLPSTPFVQIDLRGRNARWELLEKKEPRPEAVEPAE